MELRPRQARSCPALEPGQSLCSLALFTRQVTGIPGETRAWTLSLRPHRQGPLGGRSVSAQCCNQSSCLWNPSPPGPGVVPGGRPPAESCACTRALSGSSTASHSHCPQRCWLCGSWELRLYPASAAAVGGRAAGPGFQDCVLARAEFRKLQAHPAPACQGGSLTPLERRASPC